MTLRKSAPHVAQRWATLTFAVAGATLLVVSAVLGMLAGSTFEGNDGNLLRDGAAGSATDWCNQPTSFSGTCSVADRAPNLQVKVDLPSGGGDDSFGQGAKEDISNPTVVNGSIPPQKSDLIRFYTAHEKVGANTFLYLAWERTNVLGSANMDFEFNQSSTIDGNGVTPVRTEQDMLVTFDFTQGGGNPVLGVLRWLTPNHGWTKADCFSANS